MSHPSLPPIQPPAKKARKPKAGTKRNQEKKEDMRLTKQEKLDLLDIMENVLPIGQVEWEQVEREFNDMHPKRPRLVTDIRRFFNDAHKKKVPTGDPNIPEWVRRAKEVHRGAILKSDAAGTDGDEDDDVDDLAEQSAVARAAQRNDGPRDAIARNKN